MSEKINGVGAQKFSLYINGAEIMTITQGGFYINGKIVETDAEGCETIYTSMLRMAKNYLGNDSDFATIVALRERVRVLEECLAAYGEHKAEGAESE